MNHKEPCRTGGLYLEFEGAIREENPAESRGLHEQQSAGPGRASWAWGSWAESQSQNTLLLFWPVLSRRPCKNDASLLAFWEGKDVTVVTVLCS